MMAAIDQTMTACKRYNAAPIITKNFVVWAALYAATGPR